MTIVGIALIFIAVYLLGIGIVLSTIRYELQKLRENFDANPKR